MLRFLIAVVFLVAAAGGAAFCAYGPAGDTSAQIAGAEYVGSTEDGRVIRLTVSEDATEIVEGSLWDPDPFGPDAVTCGFGGGGIIGPWQPLPITEGHFEIELSIEGAEKIGDATLVGDFLPDDTVEGTFRATHIDPPCDTGEMSWSGQLIPWPGPTFTGKMSQGGDIQFTLSSGLGFVREMRAAWVYFDAPGCTYIASSIPFVSPNSDVPLTVTDGQFEVFKLLVVAEVEPHFTYEFTVSGELASETEAEGIIRIRVPEKPWCDTCVMNWTTAVDAVPPVPPAPPPMPGCPAPAPTPSPSPASTPSPSPAPTPSPSPAPTPEPDELPPGGTAPPQGDAPSALLLALASAALFVGALALAGRRVLRRVVQRPVRGDTIGPRTA